MDIKATVDEPKTRWITPDEYKRYTGEDLALRLQMDDLGGGNATAERFIVRVENEIETYINSFYFRTIDFEAMNDFRKKHFKIGLIDQVQYALNNGDIGGWSGVDESGKHLERADIYNSMIGPKTKAELQLAGLTSRHIGTGWFYGWI